ncbi:MAG: hypothetical protein EBU66_12710 [Bacteroidetes bacterium]|jgi:hypothetical protein|nr:hypothetical protein [Bacteroidota bacterium]
MALTKNSVEETRNQIVAMALETNEGKTALAQAMVEPIKNSLMYQAIGRKLLLVDELPQGVLPRYERDITAKSFVIGKRGAVPTSEIEAEELLVPTFEIAANPVIRYSEVKARRFYIVDRAQIRAKDSLQRQEDTEVFKVINAGTPQDQTINVNGTVQIEQVNLALTLIEEHELIGAKIVVPPARYKDFRGWGPDVYDQATQRDILQTGLYGHLYTADIHLSTMVPKNCVFIMAPAQFVGAMPIRQDITVLPADDTRRLRLGWVVYEELGFAVINDFSLSKILVS